MSFKYFTEHSAVAGAVATVYDNRDETIINNRAIHGDTVYLSDREVVGIAKRSGDIISVVLNFTNLTKFGKTARGVPIYRAVPLSANYPEFRVASTIRSDSDIYATIRFKEWETNQHVPIGEIVTIIGDISSPVAEERALQFKNGIYRRAFKTTLMPVFPDENRVVYRDIITIDPKESTDLDDGFHVDTDGTIYVHIVDLDYYLPETHPLNNEICSRITTVYTSKVDHMLPEHWVPYVTLAGEGRKAAVTVVFNRVTGLPESRHLSFVYPGRRLSYESAQELLDVPGSDMSLEIIAGKMGTRDSHKIIEQLMIRTNASIGELLSERPEGSIIRAMPSDSLPAKYVYANDKTPNADTFHSGIHINRYTHFTSPMRRIIDLYVLRDLKSALFGFPEQKYSVDLETVNIWHAKCNRFYRDMDLMRFCNEHDNGVHTVSAVYMGSDGMGKGLYKIGELLLRLNIPYVTAELNQEIKLILIVDRREIRLNRRIKARLA
jgi:exoribonuclease R